MKLIRSLILVILCVPAILFAQKDKAVFTKDFTVRTGTPYPVVDADYKKYFSDNSGHTVSVKIDGDEVTLQRFDFKTMREVSRKVYDDFPKKYYYENVMQFGEKVFFIYAIVDKDDENGKAMVREVDMSNGTFKAPVTLFTSKGKIARSFSNDELIIHGINIPSYFDISLSSDKSKILFTYRRAPLLRNDSKNFDIMGFYVFDNSLTKIWGDEVTLPYTENVIDNIAYAVSKDGFAHMLAYHRDTKSLEIFNIKGADNFKAHNLAIDFDIKFKKLDINEDPDGNLICSGYYLKTTNRDNLDLSNSDGIIDFKIDPNGKVLGSHTYAFPVELINEYESKRDKKKNEKREEKDKLGIPALQLRSVLINNDGSTIFIGEQNYSVTSSSAGTSNMTHTNYYYLDVIVSKVDKDGKLLWMKKLPKDQRGSKAKGGLGIKVIQNNDDLYVLYLDNLHNANLTVDERPAEHVDGQGGYLMAYKLDVKTGNYTKITILDTRDINGLEAFQFAPARLIDATNKIFMMEIYAKGKEDTMVKMELK